MNESIIQIIIAIAVLIVLLFLIVVFVILKSINIELKNRNEKLKAKVFQLHTENKSLEYELSFQRKLSKTFSDGLEALKNKKK